MFGVRLLKPFFRYHGIVIVQICIAVWWIRKRGSIPDVTLDTAGCVQIQPSTLIKTLQYDTYLHRSGYAKLHLACTGP